MKRTLRTLRLLMPGKRSSWILGIILVLVSELIATRPLFGQSAAYVITELTGGDQVPSKLNNLGDIIGRKATGGEGGPRATLWAHGHSNPKHLGVLPNGDYSSATSINDTGEITGVSNMGTAIVPFIWNDKNGMQRLPLFRDDNCGQAVAINKYGNVACYSSGPNGCRAYLWLRKTGIRDLNVLPGGTYTRAHDLNDSDEVAGVSSSSEGDHAVLWTKSGSVRDLGALPGDLTSEALAINNAGDVVGYSRGPSGMRAFLWTKSDGMQALGILPGGSSSRALDINDSGVIVGTSTSTAGDHAFVWRQQTGVIDLNDAGSAAALGVELVEAHAINRKGVILAMGTMDHGGTPHEDQLCAPAPPLSFLLTPVVPR